MRIQVMSDGQIIIPAEIRQKLGLHEGDELSFSLEGNELRLRPLRPRRLSTFRGVLPATQPYPSTEVVRQHVAETLARKRKHL